MKEIHSHVSRHSRVRTEAVDRDARLAGKTDYELCGEVRKGDHFAATELLDRFSGFIHLVAKSEARRGIGSALDVEDLVQEGRLGLLHAATRAESRETKFLTYASYAIRHYMRRHVDDMASTVRLPVYMRDKVRAFRAMNLLWLDEHGHKLNDAEMAQALRVPQGHLGHGAISTGDIRHADLLTNDMDSIEHYCASILCSFPIYNDTVHDPLIVRSLTSDAGALPDELVERTLVKRDVEALLGTLELRERRILELHFGLTEETQTLDDLAREFHFTREGIRQIEIRALAKVRGTLRLWTLRESSTRRSLAARSTLRPSR